MRRTYVQDPVTGKLVPKAEYRRAASQAPAVMPDIQPFISPVDGREISSRTHLRTHNARHGVVQQAEYGPDHGRSYFERAQAARYERQTAQDKQTRKERIQDIIRAVEKHG